MDFTPYITALVMLLGILVGTIISPRIQHKIGIEYSKRDLIFKKKLEYFEKIVEIIEQNKRMYHQAFGKIENSKGTKKIKKVIEELKQNRKNFLIRASPLYFDIKIISEKIIRFVRVEKEIFSRVSSLSNRNKKEIFILIESIKELLNMLNRRGNDILSEMKKELLR